MNLSKLVPIVVLAFVLLSGGAHAGSDLASSLCASTTGTSSILATGSGALPQQSLIGISLLIILMMLLIAAAAYMLGRSFGIGPLLKFSKDEIREVIVTFLIVVVFAGSFAAASSAVGLGGIVTGSFGTSASNIFQADCLVFAQHANGMLDNWRSFAISQLFLNSLTTIKVQIEPSGFGIHEIYPFKGLVTLTAPSGLLSVFVSVTGMLMALMFSMAVVLGIIFKLFPLFFYLGIALRTFPWTRAAGGAFLGLFIAFYFVFPFLLYLFTISYSPSAAAMGTVSPTSLNFLSSGFSGSNPLNIVGSALASASTSSRLDDFIYTVVEPALFLLFAIIFSLIISFDLMEAMGKMLGSPNLSSRHALRGLI